LTDAYQARRTQCQLPDEVGWQSKPQLAAAMVQAVHQAGGLPFKYAALVHAPETSLGMVGMAFRSLSPRERATRAWPKMSFETALGRFAGASLLMAGTGTAIYTSAGAGCGL
jgi:hypothetical protein